MNGYHDAGGGPPICAGVPRLAFRNPGSVSSCNDELRFGAGLRQPRTEARALLRRVKKEPVLTGSGDKVIDALTGALRRVVRLTI